MCSIETTDLNECSSHQYDAYITCYNASVQLPECLYSGQVRVCDNVTITTDNNTSIVGELEVCVDGIYYPVCGTDDVVSDTSIDDLLLRACESIGYTDGSYLLSYYGSSSIIDYISCDGPLISLAQCSFSTAFNNSCNDPASTSGVQITCSRGVGCNDGDVRLNTQVIAPDVGYGTGIGGYIEICVNNQYASVCADNTSSSIDLNELARIGCHQLGYLPSQTFSFVIDSARYQTDIDVISSVNCSEGSIDFTSCSISTNDTGICASHSIDAFIQCYHYVLPECFIDGQVILQPNITQSFPNYETVSGTLKICVDGVYQEVCGNSSYVNVSLIAQQACNDIGYSAAGSSLNYPSSSSDTIDTVSCPDNLYSLTNCNYTTAINGPCSDISGVNRIYAICTRDTIAPPTSPSLFCSDGDVMFYSNSTYTNRDYDRRVYISTFTGILEVCYNESYHGVCSGDYDHNEIADTVCYSLGYTGNSTVTFANNYNQYGNHGINDFTCPDNFTSLSECTFTFSNDSDSMCMYHGYDLYIQCTNEYPACSDGLYRLNDRGSFTFSNNTNVNTGRLEVCLDGEYIPVCPSTLTSQELHELCDDLYYGAVYLPNQYIGSIHDYQTGTPSQVLHQINCPSNARVINQCDFNTTSEGCSEYDEVVTCIKYNEVDTCSEMSVRVGNASEVFIPYGSSQTYTGRVEICYTGVYIDVCNDTADAQLFADKACDTSNPSSTVANIVSYSDEYSMALSGLSYIAINCTSNGVESCTNVTFNTSCSSTPLTVQCVSECPSFGRVRLQQSTTTNHDNGTTSVSGELQFCNYGYWNTVCNNNYTQYDINVFCSSLGYSNGSILSSDEDHPGPFVNLSCPSYYNYYSPDVCSIEYGDEDMCGDPVQLYCYNAAVNDQCYDGNMRSLSSGYGYGSFPNQTNFIITYVEICINGSYHLVCNDDLDIHAGRPSYYCSHGYGYNYGYSGALYGTLSDYLLPSAGRSVYNITCPYDYFNEDCTYNTVSNHSIGCSANGGAAIVTCFSLPETSDSCSQSTLIDRGYGSFSNGTGFVTGRPELCINNTMFAPICGNVSQEDAVTICYNSEYKYGAITDTVFGSSNDFAMNHVSSTIVTDVNCPVDQYYYLKNCNETVVDSNDGCLSHDPHVIVTCYDAPTPCKDSSVFLDYVEYFSDDDVSGVYYSVRYCAFNQYNTVCREGASDEEATLFCQSNGYENGFIDYSNYDNFTSSSDYHQSLVNFTCTSSLDDCSFTNIYTNCSQYNGDLVIACYSTIPECSVGDIRLLETFNHSYSDNPSFSLVSGYPVVCVNKQLLPVCNDDSIGVYEARAACSRVGYSFGFVDSLEFLPPLAYNGSLFVHNISCNFHGNCSNQTSNISCQDYLRVTCGRICNEYETRLFNQCISYTADGLERLSGIPQVCVNGGWVAVCNDGTNDPVLPTAICQLDYGYRYGRLIPPDESGGNQPAGTVYKNNITCPGQIFSHYLIDCDANDTICNDMSRYVVECFNYNNCIDGDIQISNSVSLNISTGIEYTSGYPVICVNDELIPLCTESLGLAELTTICVTAENRTYGFPGVMDGITLSPLAINFTKVATNFSCDNLFNDVYPTCTNSIEESCDSNGGMYNEVTCATVCEEDDRRLFNEFIYTTNNGLLRVVGIPQTCSGGGWVSICNDGSNDGSLPDLICQDAGYRGGLLRSSNRTLYGSSDPGTFYVNQLNCIDSIHDCDFNLTFTDGCLSGNYDYTVECFDYEVCAPGYIELANSVEYTSPEGFYYTTGYPEVCVDDQYVPLCRNTMPGPLELFSICYTAVNLTYGLRGTPSFLSVDPFTDNTSYVVTEFDCSSIDSEYCTNTTDHSNDGCALYGGYATVTCAHVCEDDDKRLFNERNYTTSDGLLRVVGIPQTCSGGGWEAICNDGSNDDNLPDLICQDAGYRGGYLVPSNRTLYGANQPGSFYLTDVTCTDSVDNCTANYTFTDECLSGNYDYTVECFNIMSSPVITQSPAPLNLAQSSTATFTCQFSGDPTPQVQWTFIPPSPRQSVILTSMGPYTILNTIADNTVNSTLTISSVMLSNAGVYRCSASNGAPMRPSGDAMLSVVVPPTIRLVSNTATSLEENDMFRLTCTESGAFPSLPITWVKDTSLVFQSLPRLSISYTTSRDTDTQLYTVQSVLMVPMSTLADNGSYTCRTSPVPVLNQPVVSNSISLNVAARNDCVIVGESSPCVNGYCIDGTNRFYCQCFDGFTGDTCTETVSTTSAPMFEEAPSDTSVLLGGQAMLSCIVTGEPQPIITWYKDGEVIPGQMTPTLLITPVETSDRGMYSCSANNSEGTVTSNGALLRIENIAQYETFLTTSSTRRRRQQQMDALEDYPEVSMLAEGREVAPNAVIASVNGYQTNDNNQIQLILTVRTAVSDNGRPVTTGVISGLTALTNDIAEVRPDLSFSQIQRFDGCLPEDTILFESVQLQWPEIGAGENASLPCPCGQISNTTGVTATRMCRGDFITISQWLNPDNTRCVFDMLSRELCNASANDGSSQGAQVLSNVAGSAASFTSDTFRIAAAFLSDLSGNDDGLTEEIASTLVEAIGKMTFIPSTEVESDSAEEILQSIDTLLNNIPTTNGQTSVVEPNIAISAQVVDSVTFNGVTFDVSTNSDGTLGEDALSGEGQATVSINVPSDILANVPDATRIGFAVQTTDIFFVQSSEENKQTPISLVLSLDVFDEEGKTEINDLQQTIDFTFTVEIEALCVFWDESLRIWSPEGCTTTASIEAVTCRCNHLSSFTVVNNSQPTTATPTSTNEAETAEEEYSVEPIIIVGAVLSAVLVTIGLLSHLVSSRQRYSQEGKIIICSHICLIVLYVTLVLASIASYTDSSGFCGTFSGLFHYMSLVYVMWIFTEGLYYIVKLKYGIGGNSLTRYLFRIMFVTSFAIPLVVVIVSVGLGYDYYAVDNSFCRPQSYSFYYGYIIPVGLIYITGMICLIMGTMITLLSPMKGSEATFRKQLLRPHLLAATILGLIILVAWVFGMVGTDNGVIGSASTATQYMFGFLLILHSIVLLLLTLFRTEDTRECWSTVFNCITGRRGKYNLDSDHTGHHKTENNIYVARERDEEGIGLGASGRFSREGSIKKDLTTDPDDVNTPLKTALEGEENTVDTKFSSQEVESKVKAEEESKLKKEAEIAHAVGECNC